MKRFLSASLLAVALLAPGCCTTRNTETKVSIESYDNALKQIRKNLTESVRPGYAEALQRSDLLPATFAAKLGVVDDTIALIDGTLTGGTAPATSANGGGK